MDEIGVFSPPHNSPADTEASVRFSVRRAIP